MSEEVEVMSAEDIPRSTPTKVGARPFNSTAIRVHWNPVPNVRDKVRFSIIGHRLYLTRTYVIVDLIQSLSISISTASHFDLILV